MSTLTISLPHSLHNQLVQLADREGVSVDQLTATALGEKIAALMSLDYINKRAMRGSRNKFEQALANVPDTNAVQHDRL